MLGKHENRFPLLAGCKIGFLLYHLMTKRMFYPHSCFLVDSVLAQDQDTVDNWSQRWKAECYPITPASSVFVVTTNSLKSEQTLASEVPCYWQQPSGRWGCNLKRVSQPELVLVAKEQERKQTSTNYVGTYWRRTFVLEHCETTYLSLRSFIPWWLE